VDKYQIIKYQLSQGNEAAFNSLYHSYADTLFNYGRQMTRHEALVEDALQETFINIWQQRHALAHVQSLKAYLISIFRRQLLSQIQKYSKVNLAQQEWQLSNEHFSSVEEKLIALETNIFEHKKLSQALKELSHKQREVLFLIYEEGLTYEEASQIIGLHVKTLYNHVYEAIKKLKLAISKQSVFISSLLLFLKNL